MKEVIKSALGKGAYLAYTALNLTHIKKKDRIVFISFPPASDNSWYLYKHALNELENFEFIWLIDSHSHEIKSKILSEAEKSPNHNTVRVLQRWSLKGLKAFSNSKFVFHTHGSYFFVGPSILAPTIVNLWHGMPIKAIGHLDKDLKKNFTYSDYCIATSEYYQTLMAKAFGLSKNQVLPTGLPRNDVLFKTLSLFEKNEIIDILKVKNNDSLVVWLPTYRVSNIGDIRVDGSNSSFIEDLPDDFLESLNQLCLVNNVKIIIKLHPMDANTSRFESLGFSNILFFDSKHWESTGINLYDLLSISKGVITDFSSVMIDCINTPIPVGFIQSSQNNYTRKSIVPVDELLNLVHIITEPQDIINMVNSYPSSTSMDNKFNSCGYGASKRIFEKLGITRT